MRPNQSNGAPPKAAKPHSGLHIFCITTVPLMSVLVMKDISVYLALKPPYNYVSMLLAWVAFTSLNPYLNKYFFARKTEMEQRNIMTLILLSAVNLAIILAIFRS